MKKIIHFDRRAKKELESFPPKVQSQFIALTVKLGLLGTLEEPESKKLDATLFEIRVRYKGQWRALYAYMKDELVIVLCAFHKKTQKTPLREIHKAKKRLKEYIW